MQLLDTRTEPVQHIDVVRETRIVADTAGLRALQREGLTILRSAPCSAGYCVTVTRTERRNLTQITREANTALAPARHHR